MTPASLVADPAYELLRQGLFCDFEIETDTSTFKVNTNFLYIHSAYFRGLLANETKERVDKRVILSDVPSCLMARVIRYCYNTDISLSQKIAPANFADQQTQWLDTYEAAMLDHVVDVELMIKLLALADTFMMSALAMSARAAFVRAWADRRGNRDIAETGCHSTGFFSQQIQDTERFSCLVRKIYELPEGFGLRIVVMSSIWNLFPQSQIVKPETLWLRKLVTEIPEILLEQCLTFNSRDEVQCRECGKEEVFYMRPCLCEDATYTCTKELCNARRRSQNFCSNCGNWGTLAIPCEGLEDQLQGPAG